MNPKWLEEFDDENAYAIFEIFHDEYMKILIDGSKLFALTVSIPILSVANNPTELTYNFLILVSLVCTVVFTVVILVYSLCKK